MQRTHSTGSPGAPVWVFAYGSLCWKPGFEFQKAILGRVQGYQRRFWQGNTTHRGTMDQPGRVATLVECENGEVHGIAFAITEDDAMPYLSQRECEQGGYSTTWTQFYPLDESWPPFPVLLYIATPRNDLWLGDADLNCMAEQVVRSHGMCGHNVEYIFRLANFMRRHFPHAFDSHLFRLEAAVLKRLHKTRTNVTVLMGFGDECVTFVERDGVLLKENQSDNGETVNQPFPSPDFQTMVRTKCLRCMNV